MMEISISRAHPLAVGATHGGFHGVIIREGFLFRPGIGRQVGDRIEWPRYEPGAPMQFGAAARYAESLAYRESLAYLSALSQLQASAPRKPLNLPRLPAEIAPIAEMPHVKTQLKDVLFSLVGKKRRLADLEA